MRITLSSRLKSTWSAIPVRPNRRVIRDPVVLSLRFERRAVASLQRQSSTTGCYKNIIFETSHIFFTLYTTPLHLVTYHALCCDVSFDIIILSHYDFALPSIATCVMCRSVLRDKLHQQLYHIVPASLRANVSVLLFNPVSAENRTSCTNAKRRPVDVTRTLHPFRSDGFFRDG